MSKCSACQNEFVPSLKSTGLPYKTCDRCRNHDKKWRDTHKDHIKDYNEHYILDNKEKVKESKKKYYETNKDKIKEEAKQYRVEHKDELEVKAGEKLLCECGMHIRRDWLTKHKKSLCHQDLLKQKESLNRELTNDEVDTFVRKKYPYRFPSKLPTVEVHP